MKNRFALILLFSAAIILLILAAFSLISPFIAAGLLAAVLLYFIVQRQIWLLLLLAPLGLLLGQIISFEVQPNWIYDISLGEIMLAAALIMFILDLLLNYPKVAVRFGQIGWLLLAYVLLGALSFWYISDWQLYVAGLKVLVFGLLTYFLVINLLDSAQKVKAFFYSLAVFVIVLSLQIFFTFYQLGFSTDIFLNRSEIAIPFGPIALVAAVLGFLLPVLLSFYFYLKNTEKGKVLFFIAFALGFIAVFIMLGKAAIGGLIIGLVYLMFYLRGRRLGVLLFCFLFGLIGYVALSQYATGLISRLGTTFVDKNTQARIEEYEVSFRIIGENPLLGVGSGQQLIYFQRMINPDYRKLINNYLTQAAVDYGIIGLIVWLAIIWAVFRQARAIRLQTDKGANLVAHGLVASLIVALFNGLFEVTIFTLFYAIVFWALVASGSALRYLPKHDN